MKKRPNIVYILTDDMGYGDVSCLNPASAFRTPNFDALAADGMAFTDAHAVSAVCTPSRYGILTGRYSWRSALKTGVLVGYSRPLIEEGRQTVANLLKSQGYRTYAVGKWHLGMSMPYVGEAPERITYADIPNIDYHGRIEHSPTAYGFDYSYCIAASLDMPPYVYIENDRFTEIPDHVTENTGKQFWRPGPTAPGFRHEDALPTFTKKALSIIDGASADEPFFLYLPLPAPHTPILPTKEFQGRSGTNEYGDFVLMCDDVVGQVRNKLIEKGLYENTILVLTADNGCSPMADFEELRACGHNPSYIFRGHKADIYEGGHRIPLLISWPDAIPAGTRKPFRPVRDAGRLFRRRARGRLRGGQREQPAAVEKSVGGRGARGRGSAEHRRLADHSKRQMEAGDVPRLRRLELSEARRGRHEPASGLPALRYGKGRARDA